MRTISLILVSLTACALGAAPLSAQNITTIAGTGVQGFSGDNGNATAANLDLPSAIAVGSGTIYFCDTGNSRIRYISQGMIGTFAGTGVPGFAGDGGPASSAQFNRPTGVVFSESDASVFVGDTANNRIRWIKPNGTVVTLAGTGTAGFSGDGGQATSAQINAPNGLALHTHLENGRIVTDSQFLYFADSGNNRVRSIDLNTGIIRTVAGNGTAGFADGAPGMFNIPLGVAHSAAFNGLYVADANNNRVRFIDSSGSITASIGGAAGFADGPVSSALFNAPRNIALDNDGSIYVADLRNNRVRKIQNGTVTTLAGTGTAGFSGDGGVATSAQLSGPRGVAKDGNNIYVLDTGNERIRQIMAATSPLVVSPATVALSTTVGASASQSIQITNSGTSNFSVTNIQPTASTSLVLDLTNCLGVTLQGGQSCTFTVSFKPTAVGAFNNTITVTANNAGSTLTASVALTLTATAAAAPQVAVSPSSLSISTAVGSTSAVQSVKISNTGGADLTVSNITSTSGSGLALDLTSCLGAAIHAGNFCTLGVRFSPTAVGTTQASITITHNAPGGSSVIPLTLVGTPSNSPAVALTPSSLSFTSTVGVGSATQMVTIANTGGAALTISNIKPSDTSIGIALDLTSCLSGPIQAGNSCALGVSYTPKAVGAFSASITITDNATPPTQTVTLTLVGVSAGPGILTVSPTSINFSSPYDTVLGTTTAKQTMTLMNTGPSTLNFQSFIISDSAAFSVSAGNCGTQIAVGASCTAYVTFHPTAVGPRTGTVTFSSDSSVNRSVALSGNGITKDNCLDADGDGLCDDWELNGVYVRVGGVDRFIDLPSMGASPNHKDVFVHTDWMKGARHTHQPLVEAMQDVVDAFAAATPVHNLDGVDGIALHIDCGRDCSMKPGATWGDLAAGHELPGPELPNFYSADTLAPDGQTVIPATDTWVQFDNLAQDFVKTGRFLIFHYVIFGHLQQPTPPGQGASTGLSGNGTDYHLGASKVMVTLQAQGDRLTQAGTLMHELGHNLGLQHGGNSDINFKPNYLSIMNYSFQLKGLTKDGHDGLLDYSRFTLPALDEKNLDESAGLRGGDAFPSYGTRWFCNAAGTPNERKEDARYNVDWNCDGHIKPGVSTSLVDGLDANNNRILVVIPASTNDWTRLVYSGGALAGQGVGLGDSPAPGHMTEITDMQAEAIPSFTRVKLTYPSQVNLSPGSTATVSLVVSNTGTKADTYTFGPPSVSGWIDPTSIPAQVSLLGGTSTTVQFRLSPPATAALGSLQQARISIQSQNYLRINDTAQFNLSVSSAATSPSSLTVATLSLNLQPQAVGGTSAPAALILSNSGGTADSGLTVSVTGDFRQTNNCGTSLGAGNSCAIQVTFTPTTDGTRTGTLTIKDNNGASLLVNLSAVAGKAGPGIGAAVNAASSQQGGLATGSLFTIYGTQLGGDADFAAAVPLPSQLAGVSVTVNGMTAPLLYADHNQVNAQIPFGLATGPATLAVSAVSGAIVQSTIQIVDASPALFLIPGGSHAASQNQDFSANATANPALPGGIVIMYFTGPGAVDQAIVTGAASPGAPPANIKATVTATVGGAAAQVLFAGMTPGAVGLAQANIVVPATKADGTPWTAGDYPVVLSVGGVQTPAGNISIAPK